MGNKQARGSKSKPPNDRRYKNKSNDDLENISNSPAEGNLTIFDCQALSLINCCSKQDEESKEFRTELTITDRENVELDDNLTKKPKKETIQKCGAVSM